MPPDISSPQRRRMFEENQIDIILMAVQHLKPLGCNNSVETNIIVLLHCQHRRPVHMHTRVEVKQRYRANRT